MKKTLLALMILATTQLAMAKDTSPITKVVKIYTYKNAAVIRLATPSTNKSNCTYSKTGEYLAIRFDDTKGREMYSAVLAAYMADTTLRLVSSGCDTIWGAANSMNKVYRVDLEK